MSTYIWVITVDKIPTLDGYFLPSEFERAQKISEKYQGNTVRLTKIWKNGLPDSSEDPCDEC